MTLRILRTLFDKDFREFWLARQRVIKKWRREERQERKLYPQWLAKQRSEMKAAIQRGDEFHPSFNIDHRIILVLNPDKQLAYEIEITRARVAAHHRSQKQLEVKI